MRRQPLNITSYKSEDGRDSPGLDLSVEAPWRFSRVTGIGGVWLGRKRKDCIES